MDTPALDKLRHALALLGGHEQARRKIIDMCLELERTVPYAGGSVREDVTGPIVDALHNEDMVLEKSLADGTRLQFLYRTKIARDFVMATEPRPDHVWEPQTTKLLVHLVQRARHALIGGAYCGDHVVLMARRMAQHGGVCHAFEPNADQLGMLRQNAQLNGLSNIRGWALGLWSDSNTHLQLVGEDSFASTAPAMAGAAGVFSTITVDDYVSQQGLPGLDLIMLDIEGAELAVLRGASRELARPVGQAPNVVFEVHRHYVDWSRGLENTDIVRLMREHGYSVFAVRDFNSNVDMKGRPIELIPPEDVYLDGPAHGFNMLAVKDPQWIDGPLFRLCHHVSPKLLWHKDPSLHHPLS